MLLLIFFVVDVNDVFVVVIVFIVDVVMVVVIVFVKLNSTTHNLLKTTADHNQPHTQPHCQKIHTTLKDTHTYKQLQLHTTLHTQ